MVTDVLAPSDGSVDARPARVRAALPALPSPPALHRAAAPTSSLYAQAAAAVPHDVRPPAGRAELLEEVRRAEAAHLVPGTALALVVLPDPGPASLPLSRALARLVEAGGTAVALGVQLPRDVPPDRSRPLTVPLRRGDALCAEWAVIACGPALRLALLARADDSDGTWSWLLTEDPVAVRSAAVAVLDRLPFLDARVPPLER